MSQKLAMPNENRKLSKTPGHWVLAQLGKKVLRPGGKELTQKMLQGLSITSADRVVEFAPGMGYTARLCLEKAPHSYTAIEQNEQAAEIVRRYLNGTNQTCKLGNAQQTGLENGLATVVYGEAMLTMQSDARKNEIVAEASRVLETGGRYGIHELCLTPNELDPDIQRTIQKEVSDTIQHPAKPITPAQWKQLMIDNGFEIEFEAVAPMHLLEPKRMIDDEGLFGFLKIAKNLLTKPEARARVIGMRKVFRQHKDHLAAITLVVRKKES
ncbi:class I SAM-dependent methyltransferase [Vibrio europaeus]|uniref:SAM-dependent methyltransferase n=1 Tax=Vibrio europaeus TaxID=300876 RepID=A0A178J5P4_9VIBR|nr:class I SAM-dependent methyltransferase [Vibrio europaeus]MDC5705715.1 class I SAM-dependent methyltransferase [Vibrio europaeus]MDC5710994.1 class I SAM-dependent methyltransferase [Vibrio europaeus]MDC5716084.1 class I SAM-dependent methyltransferase [Vibrio europaeus]MDC5720243.1 class I SAM-dependent methyltransferase [Vibrio europaeus]MDC5723868.1 class I SAM-dependent methyltransferase [Vibrio europaeus]